MKRILLIGPPGSNMKSHTEAMTNIFSWSPINSGEVLKKESQSDSETGRKLLQDVIHKNLCRDEYVIELVKQEVADCEKQNRSWMMSGFPRTKLQALQL